MTSKALKTAIATAMLTGSDALWNRGGPEQAAIEKHNKNVMKKRKGFAEKTRKADMEKKRRVTIKKRQNLMKDSMRHIKDNEGAREMLSNSLITESLPVPVRLRKGDIVKYIGKADRPGPWMERQRKPSSAVEIVEVINTSVGPPQYLVANVTEQGTRPGGPPVLVNHDEIDEAPLGRNTLGLLEEWEKLDRDILQDKYAADFYKGANLPGARVARDTKALLAANPDLIVGPTWKEKQEMKYKPDTLEVQRRKTVEAAKRLESEKRRGKKAIDEYESTSYVQKAERGLSPYIGETAASIAVKGPLGVASYLAPQVMIPLAAASDFKTRRDKKKYIDSIRDNIIKLEQNRVLEEKKMGDLYDQYHSIKAKRPMRYEKDVAVPQMRSKHIKKMLSKDKERREKELKIIAERIDAEDDDEDEEIIDEDEILINEDVPEETLLKKIQTVISEHSKTASGRKKSRRQRKHNSRRQHKHKHNNTHHKKPRKTKRR